MNGYAYDYKSEYKFDKKRLEMLKDIMMLDFAAIELTLFLDTHPEDARALADYNRYTRMIQELKTEYQRCYGPLAAQGTTPVRFPWPWVDEPWPWEIDY